MLLEYTEEENINYVVAVDRTDFSQGNSSIQCVSLLEARRHLGPDIWGLGMGLGP